MNASSTYYTSGKHDIVIIEIGSNEVLILHYAYHTNRNIFQLVAINKHANNNYGLVSTLDGTSNEYDLQSASNGKGFIVALTELSQICLAIYDTNIQPFTYTGSERTGITYNQVPLNPPNKRNDEIVLHPRAYDGAVVDMFSGTDIFAFSTKHNPWRSAYSNIKLINKSLYFPCGLFNSIAYNKSSIDNLMSCSCTDVFIITKIYISSQIQAQVTMTIKLK